MSSNIEKTKEYFEKNPHHFKNAVEEYPIMYQEAAKSINQYIKGIVLDIGSGGIINYNTEKAKKVVLADITTSNKERAKGNIIFVNGDIRLLGIKEESVDTVIMQHLLHHLADNTLKKSLKNLGDAIKESRRVLKKSGRIIIVEGMVPWSLELLQRFLFPINKKTYKWCFHFPMVLQYSERTIAKELKKAGLKIERRETIPDGDILPIFGMNLQRKWIPLKHRCIVARKE